MRLDRGTAVVERGNARISRASQALAIIAGVLTLVSAILGFTTVVLNGAKDDLNQQVRALEEEKNRLRSDLDAANARVASRDEDLRALREEVQELQTFAPGVNAGKGTRDIRMGANVTLAAGGDTVKLDSDLPAFDIGPTAYEKNEVSYRGGELRISSYFGSTPDFVVLADGVADYETCSAAQGWSSRSQFDPSLLTGSDVCIRLDSGRFATIVVSRFDKTSIDFRAVVWE